MMASLDGMVILITGAAQGIGAAIAVEAANSNAEGLMLTDKNSDLPNQANSDSGIATAVFDLADVGALKTLIEETIKKFGRIDGLVNAAGLTDRGGIEDADAALWERLFAVNARAPFFLMQHGIRAMKTRGTGGSIVNISSMNSHCGPPELAVYSATKSALGTLTKNAANANIAEGIRVNAINLGWVATPGENEMQNNALNKGADWESDVSGGLPLGRLLLAEEVAKHAVFLLSKASSPMTGVCLDLEQKVVGA